MKPSVVIIGAGVVGLSLAWELSRRYGNVTLIDRGSVGQGTTWTAAGILPPANFQHASDPMDRLRGLSHQLYPDWCNRLHRETSVDPQLRRCGGWYLADSPGERAAMAGMTQYWDEMSIVCQAVAKTELVDREPALADWARANDTARAWWVPEEYQVRPPRLIQALTVACRDAGVRIRQCCAVDDVISRAAGASVKLSDGSLLDADHVVICGGVWSGRIARRFQLEQSLIPIRGQMVLLKSDRALLRSVVNLGNRYVVSRRDGHTLVGSCEEEAGFDHDTCPDVIADLTRFAVEMIPELAAAEKVSDWSGLRPMTFDGFPMIGQVPDHPGIWLATGHYRSGIHLAPATAVTLADAITGERPKVDLDAFRVGKQQIRVV